ncbi:MAG: ABC transporter ATP-binding protein [Betaproteobacteria bacterium]|nr:ABC transporter ATP-binding protein [Betaproteobacteria bacterium]
MSENTLAVEGLAMRIDTAAGELRAVDGIDLELRKGECFALVGESGCGKSMTALSLLRLLPEAGRIAAGRVLLEGHDLLALPEAAMRAVRGRRVAMIFQEPATALNPVLTVGRQILEVIDRHLGLGAEEAKARALALLDSVGIPDAARRFEEYPFQLSGGLKQRVIIAAALAADPEVLVADEPTTALDVTIQAQILELLARLQAERGMALLLITHDLAIVAQMAHRVAVMYAGQIVELATREQFFRAPQHPYSRKLFDAVPTPEKRPGELAVIPGQVPSLLGEFRGCRFAARCDQAFERCKWVAPGLVALPGGHLSRCLLREKGPAAPPGEVTVLAGKRSSSAGEGEVLLEVAALKVHFPIRRGLFKRTVGHLKAVDGVSLQIREGRTLALVGESGCGKTTVGKAILRLLAPTGGTVRYGGEDLAALSGEELRLRRRAMQIVFQDPYASLNPRMRVGDILAEGMRALGVGGEESGRAAKIGALLEQVGLPREVVARYPHEFSGGQRQRIAIARALAVEPRLIICDEPTSALDVSVQAQILNLLRELQARLGLAYLFITHNLSVVEYLAHEVAVMYLGRIVEQGTVEEVLGSPRHPYTEALLSAVPQIDGRQRRVRLAGDLPSPANPPAGCHFHPRCPKALPECARHWPQSTRLSPTRTVNCLLYRSSTASNH